MTDAPRAAIAAELDQVRGELMLLANELDFLRRKEAALCAKLSAALPPQEAPHAEP